MNIDDVQELPLGVAPPDTEPYEPAPRENFGFDKRKHSSVQFLCPRCGGPTVLRYARQGPYTGAPFYGCMDWPSCESVTWIDGTTGHPHNEEVMARNIRLLKEARAATEPEYPDIPY